MMKLRKIALSVMLCTSVAAAGAPSAAAETAPGAAVGSPLTVGGSLGPAFSLNNGPFAVRLSGRAGYEWNLVRKLSVRAGLSLAFQPGFGGSTTALSFDLLPFGQMRVNVLPELSVYAELGVGPVFGSSSTTIFGTTVSGSYLGLGARMSGGVEYALSEVLSVGVEPIGVFVQNYTASSTVGGTTYTTSVTSSHYTVMLTAQYRL